MIVLDTNVISEALRPEPAPQIVTWLESLGGEVAITSVTLAELLAGVRRLPHGRRRSDLESAIEAAIAPYRGTVAMLAFDDQAAEQYANLLVARHEVGLPIHTADAQIAAICRAHAARLATRNVKDFIATGVDVVNPWTA
ncbi:MAG: type II toxin-antitoxin system VapC family toxin [Actinomycetales bacterium]